MAIGARYTRHTVTIRIEEAICIRTSPSSYMCDVIDFMGVRLTHNTPLQFESITRDFLTRWSLAKFKLLTITNLPPGNLHQL